MKNIVICCDGTGNEFEADASNVLKLFRSLVQDPTAQSTFYDPGVGTQGAPGDETSIRHGIKKLYGLGFATGLTANIIEAYEFLMDSWEEEDEIYLFGFSRGAYTVRALAGMIHRIGLLDRDRRNLTSHATKLYYTFGNFRVTATFKNTFSRRHPTIRFLGLFDTVKSVFHFDPSSLQLTDQNMPYTFRNRSVSTVRHAIAIDERRRFYRTNLWTDPASEREVYEQDVKQVWFAGVHSDIGGGYPEQESGLSKICLSWMLQEAEKCGLLIDPVLRDELVYGKKAGGKKSEKYVGPNPAAPLHTSLKGGWRFLEYLPRIRRRGKLWKPGRGRLIPRGEPRYVPEGALLHQSVLDRMSAGISYRPPNLPKRYQVEPWFVSESD